MNIVITSITYDGIVRGKGELLLELIDAGHKIFIVSPPGTNYSFVTDHSITYVPIQIESHGKNPISDFQLYLEYVRVYRTIKPDIVLSMTIKPNAYSGMACRRLHIPYIATINGIGDAIYNGGLLRKVSIALLKTGLKDASYVVFQNINNRDLFLKEGITTSSKTVLVPGSGVNLDKHPFESYPNNKHPIVLSYIGRISHDKGIDELLQSAEILRDEDLTINIIGACSTPYVSIINEAVNKGIINYKERVPSDQIHEIIKQSHAIILPSYHEGISNVLLESAASGRPIIASLVEGCAETFENGVSGIGFEAKSVSSLISAVKCFLALPYAKKEKMGCEAYKKVSKEFDRRIVTRTYLRLIESELKK